MLTRILVAGGLFFAFLLNVQAQDVRVTTTPRMQMETGASTKFYVKAQVGGSFNASVMLRASSPTLPNAEFTFTPERLNFPYADSSILSVVTTGAHKPGNHLIVIEGYNGPLSVRDTVTISLVARPAWMVYDMSNSPLRSNKINAIAVDNNGVAWIGTQRGLARFDGLNWTLMGDTSQTELPSVFEVCVDNEGSVYTPGYYSVEKFKNNKWTSSPAVFYPRALAVGSDNVVWAASHLGLTRHIDTTSTYFSAEDPNIDMYLTHLAVDNTNAVWVIGEEGVARFDGTYWTRFSPQELGMSGKLGGEPRIFKGVNDTMYVLADDKIVTFAGGVHSLTLPDSKNKQYPGPRPKQLAVDSIGTTWIVTSHSYNDQHQGLGRAKDGNWWSYNVGNSGLPSNTINDIVADNFNRLWICTDKGLAILNTSLDPLIAFTTGVNEETGAELHTVSVIAGISPNPSSSSAEIIIKLVSTSHVRISVMNALGQEVVSVFDGTMQAGEPTIMANTSTLPVGAYLVRVVTNDAVEAKHLMIAR
ncbi:MAG: two-component regulator propeller domain-containing protein [bacterium]|nr:two-component regulator propeller domain-containing protein [bacterium]